jgi:hypothetical protein
MAVLPNSEWAILDIRVDCTDRRGCAPVRHRLGFVTTEETTKSERPAVLDIVALLADLPAEGLARAQVGTVVEPLDDKTVLVEFTDDHGRAYTIGPCARARIC